MIWHDINGYTALLLPELLIHYSYTTADRISLCVQLLRTMTTWHYPHLHATLLCAMQQSINISCWPGNAGICPTTWHYPHLHAMLLCAMQQSINISCWPGNAGICPTDAQTCFTYYVATDYKYCQIKNLCTCTTAHDAKLNTFCNHVL